ncbi:MAG: hypothetical protein EXQ56_09810 [Acidobacteria bacterium]|nr:hypothetical protein [Acidobacteriota bacterium]
MPNNFRKYRPLFFTSLALALVVFAPGSARADTEFQTRKMTRTDVPLGKGQCDIRLRVDGEVEVSVSLDRVQVRTIGGRDARDEGSECNELLPARLVERFNFEKLDGRGEMLLLAPPDRPTGFRAVVRIRDAQGGDARYVFRLSWMLDGRGPGQPGGFGGPGGPNRGRDGGRFGQGGPGNPAPESRNSDGNQPGYDRGERNMPMRMGMEEATRICTASVRAAIDRDYRYSNAEIQHARLDNRPGRNDTIIGDATGRRGGSVEEFIFSCSVNFDNGTVRTVDVRRR